MRRLMRRLAALALFAALALPGPAPAYPPTGPFCSVVNDITGLGPVAQFRAMFLVLIPAYDAACRRGAGSIQSFSTIDDQAIIASMRSRGRETRQDVFWGRDLPLAPYDRALVEVGQGNVTRIGHFPLYVETVAVPYNLPCLREPLKMRGSFLAAIYLGLITAWDDPLLVADTPGLAACTGVDILPSARVEFAGRTTVFKDYLSRFNPAWEPFEQTQLNTIWPARVDCFGKGDDGMAGCLSISGRIGYVSQPVAAQRGLKTAQVERVVSGGGKIGEFVGSSRAGCEAAAAATPAPADSWDPRWSTLSL
ncbi:MAG: hypothetical protein ACRDJM_09595, partial [Actinomycetota bacterium]